MYRCAPGIALVVAVSRPAVAAAGSLDARSQRTGEAVIEGVGCGAPASFLPALPASASDVRVREPKVHPGRRPVQLVQARLRTEPAGAGVT